MGDAVANGEAKEGESAPCGRQGTPPPPPATELRGECEEGLRGSC